MTTTRNVLEGERQLSARSVVLSTLLGVRPPRLPTRILVRSGGLFGIAEGTTRVALSRMVAAGEIEPDGDGYRLVGSPLLERQARQDASRRAQTRRWRGAWRTEVVVAEERSATERAELRRAAGMLRLAEVREGVWLRPDNLPPAALPEAEAVVRAQCLHLSARPDGDPAALAAALWDLHGWAERAVELDALLRRWTPPLAAGDRDALAPGFVLSAAVLRHFQADPLLPAELLPGDWPGTALRAAFDRFDRAFVDVWRTWYRAQPD